jgi:uncharacterized protein YjdB
VTAASDQYSLGVVAYEMLDGAVPFGGSALEVQWAHAKEPPPPLMRADCPPALAAAVMRMLEKDPSKRWPALRHISAFSPRLTPAEDEATRARMIELAEPGGSATGAFGTTPISPLPRTRDPRRATPPTPQLALTALAPAHPELEVGASLVLEAAMTDGDGQVVSAAAVHWRSSDPSVATVGDDGTVRGVSPGSVTLAATAGEAVSMVTITVVPARIVAVEVTRPTEQVEVGDRAQLTAVATDRRGGVHPVPLDWSSSNVTIGGVSDSGLFTARAPGSVEVSAATEGARAAVAITVVPAAVASLSLSDAPPRAVAGESFTLQATPRDARGAPLAGRRVAWASSDPSIAIVTATGEVIARAPGPATITSTCEGASATKTLTVLPLPVAAVAVSAMPAHVVAGDTFRLEATARDARGRVLEREIGWRSSDERVATVRPDGTVTAHAAGTARITATAGGVERSVPLTVAPPRPAPAPPPRIAPEPPPAVLPPPVTATAIHTPLPAAEEVPPHRTSAPPAAPPAGPPAAPPPARRWAAWAGGGVAAAALLIWAVTQATSERGRPADSLDVVTVPTDTSIPAPPRDSLRAVPRPAPADSVAPPPPRPPTAPPVVGAVVLNPSAASINVGDSVRLRVVRGGGTPAGSASRIEWRSLSPAIAPVTQRGVVRGAAPGTARVVAADGTRSDTATITVTVARAAVASVVVSPPTGRIAVGETTRLGAAVADARGRRLTDRAVAWQSTNDDVASVDAASGLVTARAPGTATVEARSEGVTGSAQITVPAPTPAPAPPPPVVAKTPPAGPPAPTAEETRAAIQRVVDAYAGALNARDLGAVRRVYPSLSDDERQRWETFFRNTQDIDITLRANPPDVSGSAAAARVVGVYGYKNPYNNRACRQPVEFDMTFARDAGNWLIRGIKQLASRRGEGC